MIRVTRLLGTAAVIALMTAGCTSLGGASDRAPSAPSVVSGEDGKDVGNDRPEVSHDGLMVRRRVVVAVHTKPDAELAAVREGLDDAAGKRHLVLTDTVPDVLDAAFLERVVPELIVAIGSGSTRADAAGLVDSLARAEGEQALAVDDYYVASVLVHDLKFSIPAADPPALLQAIEREGIVSDALGRYEGIADDGRIDIDYTGPLLSDDLVQSVRAGIARAAAADPSRVSVTARSTGGVGVDMAVEPPAVPVTEVGSLHGHGALGAPTGGSPDYWAPYIFGTALLLIVTLAMMTRDKGEAVLVLVAGPRSSRAVGHRAGQGRDDRGPAAGRRPDL